MEKIKALIKRIVSHFKKNWDFEDYPMKTWKNQNAREEKVTYGAGIINWYWMLEFDETPEKALAKLKGKFKLYKENNDNLPRPGKKVPIEFASTNKLDIYENTAVHFFKNVLEMNYYDGFYSDGSSLSDFEWADNNEEISKRREKILGRILSLYNVDINDIYYEPFWKIFGRIEEKNKMEV
jgi:hypothetical protein